HPESFSRNSFQSLFEQSILIALQDRFRFRTSLFGQHRRSGHAESLRPIPCRCCRAPLSSSDMLPYAMAVHLSKHQYTRRFCGCQWLLCGYRFLKDSEIYAEIAKPTA
ncbi:MAG: hypothetical protein ACI3XZ_06970, partial [Butyricicoccus sp.]